MAAYRIYVIDPHGRRKVPVDIEAPNDHHAFATARGMRQGGIAVEVWNGTRKVKRRWSVGLGNAGVAQGGLREAAEGCPKVGW